jgi:hypothetical protein
VTKKTAWNLPDVGGSSSVKTPSTPTPTPTTPATPSTPTTPTTTKPAPIITTTPKTPSTPVQNGTTSTPTSVTTPVTPVAPTPTTPTPVTPTQNKTPTTPVVPTPTTPVTLPKSEEPKKEDVKVTETTQATPTPTTTEQKEPEKTATRTDSLKIDTTKQGSTTDQIQTTPVAPITPSTPATPVSENVTPSTPVQDGEKKDLETNGSVTPATPTKIPESASTDSLDAQDEDKEKKLSRTKTMMKLISKKTLIGSLQDQPLSKMTTISGANDDEELNLLDFAGDYTNSPTTPTKKRSFIGSDSGSSGGNKRTTFLRGTMLGGIERQTKFGKNDLLAGRELEDQIEEEVFMQSGKGEVHVLTAIKAYEITSTGETKGYKYLVVSRDSCGAYGLFVVNHNSSKSKKTNGIHAAYPILGIKQDIMVMDTTQNNVKFLLDIDGVSLSFLTHSQLKDKLAKALQTAFELIQKANGIGLILMRMAAMDFVFDFVGNRQRPVENNIESALVEIIRTNVHDDEEMMTKFRSMIRDPYSRDMVMDKLCEYVLSEESTLGHKFDGTRAKLVVHLIEYMVDMPYLSHRTEELRDKVLFALDTISHMSEVDERKMAQVVFKTATVFNAMRAWKGRSRFPNEPFPDDFFSQTGRLTRVETIQRRRSARQMEALQKFRKIASEVLLGAIICTTDGEIVGDQQMNIPLVPIEFVMSYQVRNLNANDPLFQWILALDHNRQLTQCAKALSSKTFDSSVFKKSFLTAVRGMSELFDMEISGVFDQVIKMELFQNTSVFITVIPIEDKNTLTLPRGYQWHQTHVLEHETYQRYDGIEELTPLDKLPNSMRWINSAIKMGTKPRIKKGLHVGYTRFIQSTSSILCFL